MKVAFYDGGARDVSPRVADIGWSDLVTLLTTHRQSSGCTATPCADRKCPAKLSFPAWSPVDIDGRRSNDNVRAVTVAVFDLDHLTEEQVDALDLAGHGWVLYSTHSSKPGDVCLRLVCELSRPALPSEWPAVRRAAVARFNLPADPSTKDLSRLYFLPDAPEGTTPLAGSAAGPPLDVDALLESARAGSDSRPAQAAMGPLSTSTEGAPTDLNELAVLMRRHCKPENRALVGRVLRGEPLSPPQSGPYGGQDAELQALMSTCGFCLPDSTPDDAVIHVLRPSFSRTAWGEGTEHLISEAMKKMHRARERRQARDAERLEKNRRRRAQLGIREPTASHPLDEGAVDDPDAWGDKLVTIETKEGLRLVNCEANLELVLRCSPEWRESLRFNEVTKQLECIHPPEGISSTKPSGLDIELAVWFQRSEYGALGLRPKSTMVADVLRQIVRASSYDPLHDYLDGLVWDGKPRVDAFLERYFGANDDDIAYLRAVSRRWLISAVMRGLKPGEKVDNVLVLEGPQGLRKSTAVEALSAPWCCDSRIEITNKDTWMLAAQFWMIELAEGEALTKQHRESIKAFFTRRSDTYREPYGRVNATTPRRALFVTTTNSKEYLLADPTGHRRWWPVNCTKIDIERLRADRDQLFAEAVALLRSGEQCWLTKEEEDLAKVATDKRVEVVGEVYQDMIREWFLRKAPEKRPRRVTLREVMFEALQMQPGQNVGVREKELGAVMHALGFSRCILTRGGVRAKAWEAPQVLIDEPQLLAATQPSTRAACP